MIVGAGLAGLITAYSFPGHAVVESSAEPRLNHGAVLRFRSDVVARLTGVEFRAVTVRKAIWDDAAQRLSGPTIALCNAYSWKVIGRLVDRSIWNLEPVTRYIAPENFHERLLEGLGDRVHFGYSTDFKASVDGLPIISTAPLPATLRALGRAPSEAFRSSSIYTERFRCRGANAADVYQTVYFPGPGPLYRASITGDMLIAEFTRVVEPESFYWKRRVLLAFGIARSRDAYPDQFAELFEPLESVGQRYGKIDPLPEAVRRSYVAGLTRDHEVFSVGRFATWRNILLDDVVNDAAVVKRLITAGEYDRRLAAV